MWSRGAPCQIFLREEDEELEAEDESDEELDEDGVLSTHPEMLGKQQWNGVALKMLGKLQGNEGPPLGRPG
jgi:hypothetical protein